MDKYLVRMFFLNGTQREEYVRRDDSDKKTVRELVSVNLKNNLIKKIEVIDLDDGKIKMIYKNN